LDACKSFILEHKVVEPLVRTSGFAPNARSLIQTIDIDIGRRVDAKDSGNTLSEIGQNSAVLAAAARIAEGAERLSGSHTSGVVTKESASRGPPRS
jgi:hypothetical protein